jgi:hypothetical protein
MAYAVCVRADHISGPYNQVSILLPYWVCRSEATSRSCSSLRNITLELSRTIQGFPNDIRADHVRQLLSTFVTVFPSLNETLQLIKHSQTLILGRHSCKIRGRRFQFGSTSRHSNNSLFRYVGQVSFHNLGSRCKVEIGCQFVRGSNWSEVVRDDHGEDDSSYGA